ncbi:MAG: pyruvate, phosphate dikinase [Balneolaceae bacterium]|nr:pyruvate, phosphate dikinase [Balneolaceae bacterium]
MNNTKYVYKFGAGKGEGDKTMKPLLGGKGANLGEMSSIGLPIPPGFTLSAEACDYFIKHDGEWPDGMEKQVEEGIDFLEELNDLQLGDDEDPLLVSVRSGAAISMPGMMDTVLNLGLNDTSVEGLAKKADNKRFAYDSYRRLIDMFGDVVMGIKHEYFEEEMEALKKEKGVEQDIDLDGDDMEELVERYKKVYKKHHHEDFPQDPERQLRLAIDAVFESWNTPRAVKYRKINKITGLLGTAVNVQTMVFGNLGEKSATGVCFTRNPSDGTKELYGEFLMNAQGEDVVAGIRTPLDIKELKNIMTDTYQELFDHTTRLEEHYKDMQDIEFTVQEGELFILQTRNGKRTGTAAVKIAVDFVEEGICEEEHAVLNLVEPGHLDQLLHPQLKDEEIDQNEILGKGLPASPGAAVGKVVFSAEEAEAAEQEGEEVILVRIETSPEDVGGMSAAQGILTSRGGMTSHAAVVARGWGKPCVAGCGDINIDYDTQSFSNGQSTIKAGDWISIDGTRGYVIKGKKPLEEPEFGENYKTFMRWVDDIRTMDVRTNADTPEDASSARSYGAVGIGLTRTEHMFFAEERITAMRRMIVSETEEERRGALESLLPYQRDDFKGIFEAMEGLPVTVRLLDPPLHEFLPDTEEEIETVANQLGITEKELSRKVQQLEEFNPMLGHRGCRLGITYPEITEMQTRAIIEAAIELKKEGKKAVPEIMIPLISSPEEFIDQKEVIRETAEKVFDEQGEKIDFKIGTMIEIPRAALTAGRIADEAEFFSFGTNDLTQMTFGFSRDDAGKFLDHYLNEKILQKDPFQVLDREGVGQLVEMATEKGREANPDIKIGICGEHGGDPESVEFCFNLDMNYVSCSPFRVPVARLAAAKAQIKKKQK